MSTATAATSNGSDRPKVLPFNHRSVPTEMKVAKRWVLYRLEKNENGKWTKVPYQAKTGKKASSNDPSTWASCTDAMYALEHFREKYDGVGFVLGDGFVGIDLDHCFDDSGKIEPWADEITCRFATTYQERSPSKTGVHAICHGTLPNWIEGTGLKPAGSQIEVYSTGRYFTVTGAKPKDAPTELTDCSEALHKLCEELRAKRETDQQAKKDARRNGHSESTTQPSVAPSPALATDQEIIDKASGANNGEEFRQLWTGDHSRFPSQSEADLALCNRLAFWCGPHLDHIDRMFRQSGLFRADKWDTRHHSNGDTYGQGTIRRSLDGRNEFYDWTRWKKKRAKRETRISGGVAGVIPDIDKIDGRTDVANGQRFALRFSSTMRWCPEFKGWLAWDGRRWAIDTSGAAERAAKEIYRSHWEFIANSEADEDTTSAMASFAKSTGTARGIESMLKLARSEPGMAVSASLLDSDPWSLNCLNGTLDLRTGQLRSHQQTDLITKLCLTPFDPAAKCRLWLATLNTIMAGNMDLIGFLQRALGMSLTGVIRDHVLLVLYGTGANGKSTVLNAFLVTIGDYGMKAPLGLLMAKRNEQHPTDQADLAGRRFVACNEVEEGQRLAESLVKELTGGDHIRARQLYQNFWEFAPSHHLWLSVNHKPTIRGTDSGIWRRIRLIPFSVTIADEDQDKSLPEKLQSERAGILAWAVHGAMGWAESGLGEPDEITQETGRYRCEQDVLAAFIDECCELNSLIETRAAALYAKYADWCERSGEYVLSQRRFGESLTERGYTRRVSNGIWYKGITLR